MLHAQTRSQSKELRVSKDLRFATQSIRSGPSLSLRRAPCACSPVPHIMCCVRIRKARACLLLLLLLLLLLHSLDRRLVLGEEAAAQ